MIPRHLYTELGFPSSPGAGLGRERRARLRWMVGPLDFERVSGVLFAVDTSLSERVAGKARIKTILSLSLLICRWCCVTTLLWHEMNFDS